MSNKDTYKRKHQYLDRQITTLEKHKLKLKDKLISHTRELARREKYNAHEYIKRALSMTA